MVNDSPWSCHQVDPPSWLFRRWPLLEWSSTSPKPHSYPPSILTATHWMFINDLIVLLLNFSQLFSLFPYPHRCYFCLSSKTFNELSSVSSSCSDNSQGPPQSTWVAPQIHSIQLPLGDTILSSFASDSLQPDLSTCSSSAHGIFQTCPFMLVTAEKHAGLRDTK